MTIRNLLFAALALATGSVDAAPPANDNFASRQVLSGAAVSLTATNVDATMEAGESDLDGLYGATVWYSWTAPAAGWVKVDTVGSPIDTVIRVSTGGTLAGQTLIGYNDQGGGIGDESSLTFLAVAGQVCNIAVGGFFGETGSVALRIATGDAALPPVILSLVTLSPSVVDVTGAPAEVNVALKVAAGSYRGEGETTSIFIESPTGRRIFAEVTDSTWDTANPGNQSAGESVFTVPQSSYPGAWAVVIDMNCPGFDYPRFGGSQSGAPFVMPTGVTSTLTVNNTGGYDAAPPVLRNITVGTMTGGVPFEISVGPTATNLPVRVELADDFSGVDYVSVSIEAEIGGFYTYSGWDLVRTAGTEVSGVWTGSISISNQSLKGMYTIYVFAGDRSGDSQYYGSGRGDAPMPGGELSLRILNGRRGVYHLWQRDWYFGLEDPGAGTVTADPDGDGVNNLLCMAFDLDPYGDGVRPGEFGSPNDFGALPEVTMTGAGGEGRLRIRYARRKDEWGTLGLSYVPQFGSGGGVWEDASAQAVVTDRGYGWEEVLVTDTVTAGVAGRRFGRVKVTYAE